MAIRSTREDNLQGPTANNSDASHLQMLVLISMAIQEAEDMGLNRTAKQLLAAVAALREEQAAKHLPAARATADMGSRSTVALPRIPANDG